MTISYEKFGGNNMKVLGSFVDCVYEPHLYNCLLYTTPSPRDMRRARKPSSA